MHWFAIALLALVLGFINSWLSPKIAAVIPASATQNRLVMTFANGAIILIAVFISVFLLSVIGVRESKI